MSGSVDQIPAGVRPTEGIVHKRSPLSVKETVDRLSEVIRTAGATIFAVIDQDAEAERVGLSLRETKLVIFGNPTGGTPVMVAFPLSAIDLPLKLLVWTDDSGTVWMSYLAGQWLVDRYGLPMEFETSLAAAEKFTNKIAKSSES